MIQRPAECKPSDCKNYYCKQAHRNPELGFVDAFISAGKVARGKVAHWARGNAEEAADKSTGEEEPVLRDVEVVGGWCEYLSEGVGGSDEEGLFVGEVNRESKRSFAGLLRTTRTADTSWIQMTAGFSK